MSVKVVRRRKIIIVIGFIALGTLLYLGFRSTNYDLNGISEVSSVEQGGLDLFSPNHILYRPLVWLFYMALRAVGYDGLALQPAQIITAIFSSLGLGLFYWWIRQYLDHEIVSVIATLGFGMSWAYWVFSTDVYYITPAATAVIAALISLSVVFSSSENRFSIVPLIGVGFFTSLAILLWQANVFFVIIVLIGLFSKYGHDFQRLIISVALFGICLLIVVGGVYLSVGIFVLGHRTVPELLAWPLNYGGEQLPLWGQWNMHRIIEAVISSLASLIPIWEGLGLRALLRGEFQPNKILAQISLGALALLFCLPLWHRFRSRSLPEKLRWLGWSLLVYAIYWPFIVWWDPFEPKWFVIPNIGLWAMLAISWDSRVKYLNHLILFAGLVLIISMANFTNTVWKRHSEPNVALQDAACLAEHMAEDDLFVAMEWGWPGYADYFYDREGFSLISAPVNYGGKEAALNVLRENINTIHRRNGKVYIVDVAIYPPEHLDWLASQTGIQLDDLERFERIPAFDCSTLRFQEIASIDRTH